MKSCCFFGHRKIAETPTLTEKLTNIIENLITQSDVDTFIFGSKSEFNSLCFKVVTHLKGKHPHIRRIYVRSSFPYISEHYKKYLLESYEETYFPQKIRCAGKASYVERNQEMIDTSDFCIVYYDQNYLPPMQKASGEHLADYQPKSGTQVAFDYAVKKNKIIMNLFEA